MVGPKLKFQMHVLLKQKMTYIEQDDSMPAFIRDVKAYSQIQSQYHSQHSSAIRQLQDQNKLLITRIEQIESKLKSLKRGHKE